EVGGISWREGEHQATLIVISRLRNLARRLTVPGDKYRAARRLLRDKIGEHTIHFTGAGLDLGGHDERDDGEGLGTGDWRLGIQLAPSSQPSAPSIRSASPQPPTLVAARVVPITYGDMAARATWKGFLKISLVNIPIKVFPATESSGTISFNQLHG